VKPPDRQGQRGLTMVRDPAELPAAIQLALSESRTGVALVEELVDGPELTVNAFSVGGRFRPLTVTDRITADPPAFGVALAHAWPSDLAPQQIAAAIDAAGSAVAAVGIANGPSYTQVLVDEAGPRCGEVAAGVGG